MRHFRLSSIAFLLAGILLLLTASYVLADNLAQATAADGQALFQQDCTACHTIGKGVLVGPDLQGVTQRQSVDWIKAFITAPDKVIASGDPVAVQLVKTHNNIQMPNLGLSPTQVDALVAYLSNPGAAGSAAGAGSVSSAGAVTMTTASQPAAGLVSGPNTAQAGNPANGRLIFTGAVRLANGGPQCISCHTVASLGAFGGGSLGPDLTNVYTRYGGAQGLAGVLSSLPFPTMQGIFSTRPLTAQEQADLLAFFWQNDLQYAGNPARPAYWLWGLGASGTLVLFGILAYFWPPQRQSLSERIRAMR